MCGILAYFSNCKQLLLHDFIEKLKKLHHRGQDSVGISFLYEGKINKVYALSFDELLIKVQNIKTISILGYTKYTTSGKKNNTINQPILSNNKFGEYSLIFNGNIPMNKYNLKKKYENDTMMIIDYLNNQSKNSKNWKELLEKFIDKFERAFNIIIQTYDKFYVMKDNSGVRPLVYTYSKNLNTYLFSSESCVFDNSQDIQEIYAGTIYGLNKYGLKKIHDFPKLLQSHCLFEYIS